MDEVVGHMTEKVVIPPADQIEVTPRKHTHKSVEDYLPYGTNGDMVPEMAHAGEGYKFHVTGLTHDERGYPNMTPESAGQTGERGWSEQDSPPPTASACSKKRTRCRCGRVSYGITSRVAQRAIDMARADRHESRQAAPDYGLAFPGKQNPRTGIAHKGFRRCRN
jgi:2-oxoglutarate/2-oxoacid ferredoxin oxidoreductase subunit alpha